MGAIKGILLVIVCVLLFISLLIGNIFLTLTLSLDYDNIRVELGSVMKNVVIDNGNLKEIIEKNLPLMESFCQNNSEFVFENNNSFYDFVIPCSVVAQGSEAIIDYSSKSLVEKIYYEDYSCDFWDCLEKTSSPFFLISEKAKNYWSNKFYFSLLVSLVLVALMFFLVEKKSSLFIITGSLLMISSLPFMKLKWVLSFFSGKSFLEFLTIFFTKSYAVFLTSLVLGILVIGIGLLLKLFKIGFKISKIFSIFHRKTSKNEDKQNIKEKISETKGAAQEKKPSFSKNFIQKKNNKSK